LTQRSAERLRARRATERWRAKVLLPVQKILLFTRMTRKHLFPNGARGWPCTSTPSHKPFRITDAHIGHVLVFIYQWTPVGTTTDTLMYKPRIDEETYGPVSCNMVRKNGLYTMTLDRLERNFEDMFDRMSCITLSLGLRLQNDSDVELTRM